MTTQISIDVIKANVVTILFTKSHGNSFLENNSAGLSSVLLLRNDEIDRPRIENISFKSWIKIVFIFFFPFQAVPCYVFTPQSPAVMRSVTRHTLVRSAQTPLTDLDQKFIWLDFSHSPSGLNHQSLGDQPTLNRGQQNLVGNQLSTGMELDYKGDSTVLYIVLYCTTLQWMSHWISHHLMLQPDNWPD